jgi:hypothetical protein
MSPIRVHQASAGMRQAGSGRCVRLLSRTECHGSHPIAQNQSEVIDPPIAGVSLSSPIRGNPTFWERCGDQHAVFAATTFRVEGKMTDLQDLKHEISWESRPIRLCGRRQIDILLAVIALVAAGIFVVGVSGHGPVAGFWSNAGSSLYPEHSRFCRAVRPGPTRGQGLSEYELSYESDFTGTSMPKGWITYNGIPSGEPGPSSAAATTWSTMVCSSSKRIEIRPTTTNGSLAACSSGYASPSAPQSMDVDWGAEYFPR